MRSAGKFLRQLFLILTPSLFLGSAVDGQQTPASQVSPFALQSSSLTSPPTDATTTLRLTLPDALDRAKRNSVDYQSALSDAGIAREDRNQARDALLPSINYNNSYLYTQGVGRAEVPRFIASNAVHEYVSQGNVREVISPAGFANLSRATASAAIARARAEVAARGLVVTVVRSYYAAIAARRMLESSQRAADEGERFFKLTQDLENGGEVAHSDVIKAELQTSERLRQLQDAKLAVLNARLDLAVLIFPNLNGNFELAEDLHDAVPLPSLDEVQQRAAKDNPEVRAALEAVKEASFAVNASRAEYFPSLSLDYFYGIDATHFATRTDGVPNLGYSAIATLNIPVWNWGATQSRVKQAELRRNQAKVALSFSQRKLLAELQSLYAEADVASNAQASLSRSAELAAESLRLTTLRYKDGESTVLEVVDAQNTATLADTAFQDGAVRYRVALANLQTLTGAFTKP
jgi:outer membrane protein